MRVMLPMLLALATLTPGSLARAQALSPEETELLELINAARAEAGLGPVVVDSRLCEVARSHSRDMNDGRFFSHISPRTGSPGDRLRAAGVPFRLSGENIAIDQSVEGAHRAFMHSPGHRRNVLDPEFSAVGIGIVARGRSLYVTQHFITPRPGFVASVPPSSPRRPTEAVADEPAPIETVPSPHPCGRCDVSADDAGRAAGVAEAPAPIWVPAPSPPVYAPAPPVYAPSPPVYSPAPATTEVWIGSPGGGWQLVPAPW